MSANVPLSHRFEKGQGHQGTLVDIGGHQWTLADISGLQRTLMDISRLYEHQIQWILADIRGNQRILKNVTCLLYIIIRFIISLRTIVFTSQLYKFNFVRTVVFNFKFLHVRLGRGTRLLFLCVSRIVVLHSFC